MTNALPVIVAYTSQDADFLYNMRKAINTLYPDYKDTTPGSVGYKARAALHSSMPCPITRAQALEWAPYNVQVNAIAPGIFPDPVTFGEEGARHKIISKI